MLQLLALILASSPNWHRSVHEGESHPDHQCLATLIEHGQLEEALPVCAAPEPVFIFSKEFPRQPIPVFQPGLGLPPSRGPPV